MHCFTYGSLMCDDIMAAVCGLPVGGLDSRPARLADFVRHPVRGETYPGMVAAPGQAVEGRVYLNLPASAWPRLDTFEGEYYERQSVRVALAERSELAAETYVFRPQFDPLLGEGDWDFEAFLREGKARFGALYLGFTRL
jgi:hypothetical protein